MVKYALTLRINDVRAFNLLRYNDHELNRSKSETVCNDSDLVVNVSASDATSLRATLDGYVKALKVFEATENLINC